ncbi:MAG: iron ABC transporter substrate-binding protein [Candidatus Binatia bacterium]
MVCARATRVAACAASLLISFASAAAAEKRVIVDSAGRSVEVPAKIARVFAAGGPASVFIYTLAPDKLLGWNRPLTPEERTYIPSRYANLPTLGRLTGRGNTANVEVMLASRPDVIIDYGAVNPTYVSLADRVQQQTGVPYLLFDGSLSQVARAYIAAGETLGAGERAKELARYAEGLLAEIDDRVAQVPHAKRPLVYYARGPRGLQTGLKGSINVESLERIGARNIAAEHMGTGGIVTVSPEQLLAWNPEVVITIESDFFDTARSDEVWKSIKAVRDSRLYVAPTEPFPWLDFPPSVNRLIGLKWLGRILYPQRFSGDLREETRRFYGLFYHQPVDDRQLDALLKGSGRAGR